ncbi:MAG: hypothetical protein Q8S19_04690 [Bacillota bacterium]|nr:hypothetical protein [Bacillota bacterium]
MKLSKREIILVAALFIIATFTVLYLYFWQPLSAKKLSLLQEIAQLETTIARLAPWEAAEQELHTAIEGLKAKITASTEQRELGIPLPEFLVMVEGAVSTSAITLQNTSLHVTEIGGISTLNISGSYQSLYRFLSILEEQDQALVLESLQFAGLENNLTGLLRVRLFSGAIIGEAKEGGYPTRSLFTPRK